MFTMSMRKEVHLAGTVFVKTNNNLDFPEDLYGVGYYLRGKGRKQRTG